MDTTIRLGIALLASTALAPAAFAQDVGETDQRSDDHKHGSEPVEIVITGALPDSTLLENVRTLDENAIVTELDTQIGEVLDTLPGVSTSGFAPGASRPVIRGFDGERVKLLIDSIGSIDAADISVDHGVTIDPLIVDHIDVVQGPAVLLFGGEAIGGAVNVIDRRIPRELPEGGFRIDALASYGSAADFRALSGSAEAAIGSGFVFHVDGSFSESDDLRVGGRLVSDAFRAELLADAAEEREEGHPDEAAELEEAANATDRVPNTFTEATSFGGGFAYIGDRGTFGFSARHYDTRYGVPGRPGGGHAHEEEEGGEEEEAPVSIDLQQTRYDFRGTLEFDGFFESALLRFGYAEYDHIEFEGDEVGTTFDREAFEGRIDLVQRDRNGWHGHVGASYTSSDLEIVGEEAFFPGSRDRNFALFTLQAVDIGALTLDAAARYQKDSIENRQLGVSREFDLFSGALGVAYRFLDDDLIVGAQYIRGARAPSNSELLSNGLHVATQAIEVGNPDFGQETSNQFEAYARYEANGFRLSATGFHIDFDGFITAFDSGAEDEGFPIFEYRQVPARFTGFELDGAVPLIRSEAFSLTAEAAAEFVHAEREGNLPVPRIPPFQLSGGLRAEAGAFRVSADVEHNFEQDRVEPGAAPVAAYTLVNAAITWQPLADNEALTLSLVGDNLFDEVGRRATSFTRDFLPIAGRDIRLTAKLRF
ncbi:TonB-dependent receptor [Blastomonas marina]|jgi:iron complex outermembrane recepter protein|uniref:TonB-dependent receptor n=1 Tax=Blastomonas marina TaxID=1867408 RepID=UPI002AC9CE18|nr:TonB-dependent receptor [Blastomonas marina]WPZ04663.1 TonB-dependent receptor [Blastomonas marina]